MQYTDVGETWQKLFLIAGHAQRDKSFQFTSLAHLLNESFLRDCFYRLNRNKAVGLDAVTWKDYSENLTENLTNLVQKLKRKSWKPIPARRVYIPKSETEKRPIGISAIENKIVEKGLAIILESIYEQDFRDCSYGFRPRRNCHQALQKIDESLMFQPANYIIEADIKGFFDSVRHEYLMAFIRIRIGDTVLLDLIERFLKAGYVDNGLLVTSDEGTPQGSIVSPILANIFLHYVLDQWVEKSKPLLRGFCQLVRYADDFVLLVKYKDDAEILERGIHARFERCGLTLHPEKTRTFSFGRFERETAKRKNRRPNTFDFLGITHFCGISRKGKFKIGRKTNHKRFRSKLKTMNEWLKNIRNRSDIKDWWPILAKKLTGHYQYYGISENFESIDRFYQRTMWFVFKSLNRRSQKRSLTQEQFWEYLKHYPLPTPRIYQAFTAQRVW
jgi:RNA-directed DNA polymerase